MTLTISGAIMLPPLRRQLKTLTNKNQALQDILSTCTAGTRLMSVEKVESKVHNTKITVLMPDGRERIHFYNRVDIESVIPEDFVHAPTPAETATKLNILGLDFHESDFLLDGCGIILNPFSLGYYGDSKSVPATVPLDTIEFAVKTLPHGEEFADSIGGYGLCYKVGDEVFFSDFRSYTMYTRLNTLDLATQIKNEIESFTTDVSVKIIASDWYEEQYRGYESLGGYIIAITNNLDKPVDVSVILNTASSPNPETHDSSVALLPNARLQPKGTKGAFGSSACGGGDSAVAGGDLAFVYHGLLDVDNEPFTLNGAAIGTGWSGSWLADNDLNIGMLPYDANSGLNTVVRVYTDVTVDDLPSPNGNPRFMFKNMSDYPITINSPRFEEPVVLGPVEYRQPLDRVFINTNEQVSESASEQVDVETPETTVGGVTINDVDYSFPMSNGDFDRRFGAFIKFALDAAGEDAENIKFAWMRESAHGYLQAYFENMGEVPLKISFWIGGTNMGRYNEVPAFILEPAGTVGLPYDLDNDVAFSDQIPGVSNWLSQGRPPTNIHWRGVTHTINDGYMAIESIFNIGGYYGGTDRPERVYFENISPYVEEVIFDYGLETEFKIRLRPSRIVTATRVPT